MTEHDVETARQEVHTGVPGMPLDDPHPLPDALGFPANVSRTAASDAASCSTPVT